MTINPHISIIIPLYNKEFIIERTIQSVLSQSFQEFELIIVNDGSTDKSMEVVLGFHDERIVITQRENGGPSAARNTGIKIAKGKWIVFLDADDELDDDALNTMLKEVNVYSDADIIDFGGYIREGKNMRLRYHPLKGKVKNALKAFFFRDVSPGCGHSIFCSEFVRKHPYDEKLRRFEDCEILLRMLPVAKVYSSQYVTEIHDINYAEASRKRSNISEDFSGHLSMRGRNFWAKMCVYQMYLENRELYPEEMRKLYPLWRYRYDLLLLYKVLTAFHR